MTVKTYVLTFPILKMLQARGLVKKCRNCGCSFNIGDVVVSKFGSTQASYWYCRKCAIKLKII
jgi:hypothetical protein